MIMKFVILPYHVNICFEVYGKIYYPLSNFNVEDVAL